MKALGDIARRRLVAQGIEGRPRARALDVVRSLAASQAQDFAGAKWALALRTADDDDASVERAFDDGSILRTHVMRPTWHFVAREDIRWLLALTAPRVRAVNAYRYRQLDLAPSMLDAATAVLTRVLAGGRTKTREELRAALSKARIDPAGQRTAYILMHAELEAAICSGPRRGRQFTYALLEDRAPRARRLSREDGLAELAGRYFASRGPATVQDFAKWSGLSAAEARAGLEAVSARLEKEVVEGATYWSRPSGAGGARRRSAVAHLLSIYDEYISSYRDRSAICDPVDAKRLVGQGSALAYLVVVNGRIAGTCRRSVARGRVRVQVMPFRALAQAEERAVAAAAARFALFQGPDTALVLEITR